ncbi:flagellin [Paracoccus methylarcula]|uniref:Flagellin n=1 Tax=Paracoccus methylarcula TaxID=72022 RepID=A0A422QXX2_9RHOB|nr:flagellin [Paracoccus methylarcula]RNF34811.1 flagellin [Paracoccus methylarcula]
MTSILTNNGAIVALQTLKMTNMHLEKTQQQISTGKKIGSAKDNAALWSIAKIMETDETGFRAIKNNLNAAGQTVATAVAGANEITDVLKDMMDLATNAGTDGFDFATVNDQITNKHKQIKAIISGTQMNGVNLLKKNVSGTKTDFTILASLDRSSGTGAPAIGTIVVNGLGFDQNVASAPTVVYSGDSAPSTPSGGTTAPATGAAPATATTGFSGSITQVTDTASAHQALAQLTLMHDLAVKGTAALGNAAKRIEDQVSFVTNLADSLKLGIGSLVDADLEESSARLQALQAQQQLGIQALSVANQAPQSVLALFR